MGVKISELPAASALAGTELIPVMQGGETRQAAVSALTTSPYIRHQLIPAAVWTIPHGMNRTPSVTVIDSTEAVVYGDIQHDSSHQLTISFSSAFAGTAYLV